jgi:hypothetical protein
MSLSDVRRILGDPKARLEGNAPVVPLDECAYIRSERLPEGLEFMLAQGRLARIDVFKGAIKTVDSAGIGDSEARISQIYSGRIRVEPHHYHPQGHYLHYLPTSGSDRKYGMVFETDGHQVTSFRVGRLAAIALVEGCS